ncbi:Arc family DNA-binding protein [Pseudomonas typographi]|uniref:Arc family DNA-binding protein n=1 Tax=Pseudomonas typographi TaxID=2715964 RepID=A0ABR7YZM2_9PSED|nr:Arc family DNA-binding protein [Pseudomonas typographi]MBD1586725.1 Arc family DNA-binding protein [Pseudomonas typographi]MBD1598619.1 Arc family DNA-binding protein [Pseudomonas typographi]
MPNSTYNSRSADKFVVRLPDGLREQVEHLAREDATSMNTLFIQATKLLVSGRARQALLLDALEQAVMSGKDPVKAYIQANPEGYPAELLARGRGTFVDEGVRASYLVFLSGFRAAQGIEP